MSLSIIDLYIAIIAKPLMQSLCRMVRYEAMFYRDHPEVLSVLVEKGHIDVNITNFQRLTPLHVAVHKGHVECAKRLIAYGCDVNLTVITRWCRSVISCAAIIINLLLFMVLLSRSNCCNCFYSDVTCTPLSCLHNEIQCIQ